MLMLRSAWIRVIAHLLRLGNSYPGSRQREFYELKDRLLRRYGTRDGTDIQHIVDPCWGYAEFGTCLGKLCQKCRGTGVWMERWIELERWEIAGYVFHRPVGPLRIAREVAKALARNVIEGRITHRDVNPLTAKEARLWLMLLCAPRAWLAELTACSSCGWHWRPMIVLQKAVFRVHMFSMRCGRKKCHCGRRIIHPFDRRGWCICRRCRRASYRQFHQLDSELPF